MVAVQTDPELDRNRAEEGLLEGEEGEAQNLGPAAESTSGERQARVSEPGRSTDLLLSDPVAPTSKPGTGSEMPEGVLEPGQPDHRSREIPAPVSRLFDLASEKRSSQDRADLTARVPASTVMEYSSVKVRVEFCLLTACYRRDPTLVTEEAGAMA